MIRQQPPGRRPRSRGRVLNGPARRSLAGARRPPFVALFACLGAGGAKAVSPTGWRFAALSGSGGTPLRGLLGPPSFRPSLCSKRQTDLFRIRQRPPGRRPRSSGRVLDGPGGRSLAGPRRPAIAALFACLGAGGAKAVSPSIWRFAALSDSGGTPLRGLLAPSFRPLSLLKAGNRSHSDSPAASWTEAALKCRVLDGPGGRHRDLVLPCCLLILVSKRKSARHYR